MRAQELSEGWREILDQKQELASLFQDMEQQLQGLTRRPAELEPKIAQNMLDQARVRSSLLSANRSRNIYLHPKEEDWRLINNVYRFSILV